MADTSTTTPTTPGTGAGEVAQIAATIRGMASRHISFVHIPEDGEPGPAGPTGPYIPPPMMYEDYPAGYIFRSGGERIDVVLTKSGSQLVAWECIKDHSRNSPPWNPVGVPSEYWRRNDAGYFNLVATRLLLADSAFIGLMSSNGIRIYDTAGNIVGGMVGSGNADGSVVLFSGARMTDNGAFVKEPTFAVSEDGKTFFGSLSGRRIEMDPVAREMRVFNDQGQLCSRFGGQTLTIAEAVPGGGTSGSSTAINASAMSWNVSSTSTKTASGAVAVASGTSALSVSIPAFSGSVRPNTEGGETSMAPSTRAILYAEVMIGGEAVYSRKLGEAFTTAQGASVFSAPATTLAVPLSAGDSWQVRIRLEAVLTGGSGSGGAVIISASGSVTTQIVADLFQAVYMATGLALSINSKNYFYAIAQGGRMNVKAVSDGLPLIGPAVLFKGVSNAGTDGALTSYCSFDGLQPSVTRSSSALTISTAAWASAIGKALDQRNCHVQVQCMGSNPATATVAFGTNEIKITYYNAQGAVIAPIYSMITVTYFPDAANNRI